MNATPSRWRRALDSTLRSGSAQATETAVSVGGAVPGIELLDELMADMAAAPALYRPTSFWEGACNSIADEMRAKGIDSFRSHASANAYFVPNYAERSNAATHAAELLRSVGKHDLANRLSNKNLARYDHAVVAALDPDRLPRVAGLSESDAGKPWEHLEFDGDKVSRSFLNYQRGLVLLKRTVPDLQLSTVLEIGGGYGTLGEILAKGGEGIRYIDVDIPPVGFASTWYLSTVLGPDRVATYADLKGRDSIAIDELPDATVLPSWQLPVLSGSVDLFVNFISFQEMEPEVVANYVSHVKRLGAKYVLLRNSVTGKPVKKDSAAPGVHTPVVRATYLDLFSDYELLASDRMLFGHAVEGGLQSEVMILKRRGI